MNKHIFMFFWISLISTILFCESHQNKMNYAGLQLMCLVGGIFYAGDLKIPPVMLKILGVSVLISLVVQILVFRS